MSTPTRAAVAITAVLAVALSGCSGGLPAESAAAVLDEFEAEGLAECTERREPLPDLITCEDEVNGDLTVMFTDTEEDSVRVSSRQSDGPWLLGSGFIVVSYDQDPARLGDIRDLLGTGELYGVDADGNPVPLEDG